MTHPRRRHDQSPPLTRCWRAFGLLGLALVVAAACSAPSPSEPAAAAAPVATPSTLAVPGLVHPTSEQRGAYLKDLEKIDRALVRKPDTAYAHGRDVCLDSYNDKADGQSITLKHVMARDDVRESTARKIISVARANLCPTPEFTP